MITQALANNMEGFNLAWPANEACQVMYVIVTIDVWQPVYAANQQYVCRETYRLQSSKASSCLFNSLLSEAMAEFRRLISSTCMQNIDWTRLTEALAVLQAYPPPAVSN